MMCSNAAWRMLIWLAFFLVPALPAGADVTIGGGARLVVRNGALADLNCGKLTVADGGTLDISDGGYLECGDVTLAHGALFKDLFGSLSLNGIWENNSGFTLSDGSDIYFTTACGVKNSAAGESDTDGDGLSDDEEGLYGTNPLDTDSDDDNVSDALEVAGGSDPLAADAGPGIPVLVFPEEGAVDTDLATLLEVDYGAGASNSLHRATQWQISRDSEFSAFVMDITSEEHLLTLTVPELVLDGEATYFWRVRFVGADGLSRSWSETGSFTTAADSGDENGNGLPDDQEASGDAGGGITPIIERGWSAHIYYLDIIADDGTPVLVALQLWGDGTILEYFGHTPAGEMDDSVPLSGKTVMGLFSIKLKIPDPGDETAVRLYFSPSLLDKDTLWSKYDSVNGWLDYTGYVAPTEDLASATVELVDGGYGDADGIANGIIVDPLGAITPWNADTDNGSCFIASLPDGGWLSWCCAGFLILLLMGAMVVRVFK